MFLEMTESHTYWAWKEVLNSQVFKMNKKLELVSFI